MSNGGECVNEPALSHEEAREIRASLDGDEDAYARIVRRHQDAIAQYMWRFTRDRTTHEELVQDVFVEAFFSLHGFRGRSPLLHWLRRIGTRVGYRYWRQRRRVDAARPMPVQDWNRIQARAREGMAPGEAAEIVCEMLAQLPPRDRLVLTLMYLEGLTVRQVTSLTGWTQSMVKVQAYRARQKLRRLLDREESC